MRGRIVVALGWLSVTVLLTQIVTPPPSFAAGQSTQAAQVMRAKLEHSEQLLAALVTSDWAGLGHHARALQDRDDHNPVGLVLRLPEFNKIHERFPALDRGARPPRPDAARSAQPSCGVQWLRRQLCGMPSVCRAGPHRPRTLIRRRTRQSCAGTGRCCIEQGP